MTIRINSNVTLLFRNSDNIVIVKLNCYCYYKVLKHFCTMKTGLSAHVARHTGLRELITVVSANGAYVAWIITVHGTVLTFGSHNS